MKYVALFFTVALGVLWSQEGSAADPQLSVLIGIWAVESISPDGMIPSTIEFTGRGGHISGVWRYPSISISAMDADLDSIKQDGASISFKIRYRDPIVGVDDTDTDNVWKGRFKSKDELQMNWMADDGHVRATRIFKRASPARIALIKKDFPQDLVLHPLPLPALRHLPPNGAAMTPPMGWSSWNQFKETINDKTVREIADTLVTSGLRDAGYVYVDIDDGWQGRRDKTGALHPNSKFPDMKALADYVHSRGLKLGLYSSPGPLTCTNYVGSHGHETIDAQTFARWGIDYIRYDWCSAWTLYKSQAEMQAVYQKFGEALQATGRPIIYGLCQYGIFDVGSWGRKVGGNMWRTGGDTIEGPRWRTMSERFETNGEPENGGPGGWNDPDHMLIGIGGMTNDEYRTHMTLWVIQAAPLTMGNDIRKMTNDVRDILLNKEVIAVDQDALGKQGQRIMHTGDTEVWTKWLSDGSAGVALFNRGEDEANVSVSWADLNLQGAQRVRDLWQQKDLGDYTHGYTVSIPKHGSVLLRVRSAGSKPT